MPPAAKPVSFAKSRRVIMCQKTAQDSVLCSTRPESLALMAGSVKRASGEFILLGGATLRGSYPPSFHILAHSFALLKTQLHCFQSIPHSLPQNTGGRGTAHSVQCGHEASHSR